MNEKEMAKVYETLLSVPGMNETVKMDLRLPRRTVLMLAQVIEKGLEAKSLENGEQQELQQVATDCLEKAGLTELNNKLQALQKLS